MFNNKITFFHENISTKEEALKVLSNALEDKGHVKESFYNAVISREKQYPTGLQTSTYGVAIPHTDAIHVNEPQIAFMSLATPVTFESMDGSGDVSVSIIIMLAMGSGNDQLTLLQRIVSLFQSQEKMEALYNSKDIGALDTILSEIGIQ